MSEKIYIIWVFLDCMKITLCASMKFIEDLAVSKEYRGQGFAKALLQKFIEISRKEQSKKQPYCLSSTDVTNKASIKLHLRVGFKKLGVIKELHYGKDEIIFGYKL